MGSLEVVAGTSGAAASAVVVLAEASGAGETAASVAAGVSEALAASTSLLIELLFSSTSNVRIHWEKGCYRSGNPQQSRFVTNQRFAQTSKLKVA